MHAQGIYIGIVIITVCGIHDVVAIISPAALELILHIYFLAACSESEVQ